MFSINLPNLKELFVGAALLGGSARVGYTMGKYFNAQKLKPQDIDELNHILMQHFGPNTAFNFWPAPPIQWSDPRSPIIGISKPNIALIRDKIEHLSTHRTAPFSQLLFAFIILLDARRTAKEKNRESSSLKAKLKAQPDELNTIAVCMIIEVIMKVHDDLLKQLGAFDSEQIIQKMEHLYAFLAVMIHNASKYKFRQTRYVLEDLQKQIAGPLTDSLIMVNDMLRHDVHATLNSLQEESQRTLIGLRTILGPLLHQNPSERHQATTCFLHNSPMPSDFNTPVIWVDKDGHNKRIIELKPDNPYLDWFMGFSRSIDVNSIQELSWERSFNLPRILLTSSDSIQQQRAKQEFFLYIRNHHQLMVKVSYLVRILHMLGNHKDQKIKFLDDELAAVLRDFLHHITTMDHSHLTVFSIPNDRLKKIFNSDNTEYFRYLQGIRDRIVQIKDLAALLLNQLHHFDDQRRCELEHLLRHFVQEVHCLKASEGQVEGHTERHVKQVTQATVIAETEQLSQRVLDLVVGGYPRQSVLETLQEAHHFCQARGFGSSTLERSRQTDPMSTLVESIIPSAWQDEHDDMQEHKETTNGWIRVIDDYPQVPGESLLEQIVNDPNSSASDRLAALYRFHDKVNDMNPESPDLFATACHIRETARQCHQVVDDRNFDPAIRALLDGEQATSAGGQAIIAPASNQPTGGVRLVQHPTPNKIYLVPHVFVSTLDRQAALIEEQQNVATFKDAVQNKLKEGVLGLFGSSLVGSAAAYNAMADDRAQYDSGKINDQSEQTQWRVGICKGQSFFSSKRYPGYTLSTNNAGNVVVHYQADQENSIAPQSLWRVAPVKPQEKRGSVRFFQQVLAEQGKQNYYIGQKSGTQHCTLVASAEEAVTFQVEPVTLQ